MVPMTTREKVQQLLDQLSETELEAERRRNTHRASLTPPATIACHACWVSIQAAPSYPWVGFWFPRAEQVLQTDG